MKIQATTLLLCLLLGLAAYGQDMTVSSSRKGSMRVSFGNSYGIGSFNVESRGKIELSDDDKDVRGMSPDGYLEITKTVFGSRRSLVITPSGNSLKREYYEGRTSVAFEPEGRKWLSEILPELVRSTTIGAESRVNRFFSQGGSKSVIEEIGRLESDYVKAHYANALMELNIPVKDYATITSQVASTMESDHYLTEFLKKNMVKFMQSKEASEAVFAATQKMESDHYKTEVIKEGLRTGPISLESVKILLTATGNMESDHYKTEVLTALLKQDNLTDAIVGEMINTTRSMESDHYRTVVLNKALEKQDLSAPSYQKVLESIKDIGSDHYKTEVLTRLLRKPLTPEAQTNLINIMSTFESDHYVNTIAGEMLKQQTLNDAVFQKLLETMSNLKSDYYVSNFLEAALDRPNLTKQNLTVIIQSATNMESDHYVTEVLVHAAPKVKALNDSALKDSYRLAARKIESETYYGRALRAID